jgi:DNA-binding NarL/FixJ family response regulator
MHMDEDKVASGLHSGPVDVLRLLIVDEHQMVSEALAARLSMAPGLWVAGCATTSDPQLPEKVGWLRPDVIIIDVEPLGCTVGEVLQQLAVAWPPAHVVVVSACRSVDQAVAAARSGASAWMTKDQGADHLETVVRGVCSGWSWFPPELLGAILRELRQDVSRVREAADPLDVLSPRERDVLACMVEGKQARQIAEELIISIDTVRTHTRGIFSKLDVHSRLEAVSMARAAGLRPRERPAVASKQSRALPLPQPPSLRVTATTGRGATLADKGAAWTSH